MQKIGFSLVISIGIIFLGMIVITPVFGYDNLIVSRDEAKRAVAEKLAADISENWSKTLEGRFDNLKGCTTYVPNNWSHKTHFFYVDRLPPSFNVGFHSDEHPLSINSNDISHSEFSSKSNPIRLNTGEPIKVVFTVFEESGAENIQTFSVSTNHQGTDLVNFVPDTHVMWSGQAIPNEFPRWKGVKEIAETVQVEDPSGLFSKVNVSTSRDKNKLELTYDLEFVKPMKNSNIIVFTSDRTGNPRVCNILNVWEVNSGSDIISSADPTPKFITTEKSECRESLKKIIRISDGSGVCVKPLTAEKLIERNWAIPSE